MRQSFDLDGLKVLERSINVNKDEISRSIRLVEREINQLKGKVNCKYNESYVNSDLRELEYELNKLFGISDRLNDMYEAKRKSLIQAVDIYVSNEKEIAILLDKKPYNWITRLPRDLNGIKNGLKVINGQGLKSTYKSEAVYDIDVNEIKGGANTGGKDLSMNQDVKVKNSVSPTFNDSYDVQEIDQIDSLVQLLTSYSGFKHITVEEVQDTKANKVNEIRSMLKDMGITISEDEFIMFLGMTVEEQQTVIELKIKMKESVNAFQSLGYYEMIEAIYVNYREPISLDTTIKENPYEGLTPIYDGDYTISAPVEPTGNKAEIDQASEILTYIMLTDYLSQTGLLKNSYLYKTLKSDKVENTMLFFKGANLSLDLYDARSIDDLVDYAFESQYKNYSESGTMLLDNYTMAAHPALFIISSTLYAMEDKYEDNIAIKEIKFQHAISENPYNVFLLEDEHNTLQQKRMEMQEYFANQFKAIYGDDLTDDQIYSLNKTNEILDDIIDMNSNYDSNISELEEEFVTIEKDYWDQKREADIFYKMFLDPDPNKIY